MPLFIELRFRLRHSASYFIIFALMHEVIFSAAWPLLSSPPLSPPCCAFAAVLPRHAGDCFTPSRQRRRLARMFSSHAIFCMLALPRMLCVSRRYFIVSRAAMPF